MRQDIPADFLCRVFTGSDDTPFLRVTGACHDGDDMVIQWGRTTPNGPVAILYSPTWGSATIPDNRACPGTVLALSAKRIQIAWTGSSGPRGAWTGRPFVSNSDCGGVLQLLDLTTCRTSNPVRLQYELPRGP